MRVLEQIWWQYPHVIDFLLYFFFFGALTKAGLYRHFGDKSANRLAVTLGLCLAAGLVTAQDRIGFAVADLGPIGIALIVFACALVLYRLLRFADVPAVYAGAMSVLFGVIGVKTLDLRIPGADLPMNGELATFFWILVGILAWHGLAHSRNGFTLSWGKTNSRAEKTSFRDELRRLVNDVGREISTMKRHTLQEGKEASRGLSSASSKLALRPAEVSRDSLSRTLRSVDEGASHIAANLSRLRRLDRALEKSDWTRLQQSLSSKSRPLNPREKRVFEENVRLDRARLRIEERIEALARDAEAHTLRVRDFLRRTHKIDQRSGTDGLKRLLTEANQEIAFSNGLSKRVLALEQVLLRLLKRQMRTVR